MLMVATGAIPRRDCERDCIEPDIRRMRGCDGDTSEFPFYIERDDGTVEKCFRCPYALLKAPEAMGAWKMLRHHEHYEAGYLPFEGGTERQPQKVMDAIDFIRANIDRYRKMAEEM